MLDYPIHPPDHDPPPAAPRRYPEDVPKVADLMLEVVAINDSLIALQKRANRALGALSEHTRRIERAAATRKKAA